MSDIIEKPVGKKRGRKAREIKRVPLTIRVEPFVAMGFETMRLEAGMSQSKFLTHLVKIALINSMGGIPND
jgi:hypothetical protein